MPQLNLFGNTSIFPDTGSTDIFGNQSTDIFAAEENASDDIFENDTQDVQIFAWIDYDDDGDLDYEEDEHSRIESSITYILENVIPNPSTSEGVMIAHVLNSFLDLLD
jgi:hypothetical protein